MKREHYLKPETEEVFFRFEGHLCNSPGGNRGQSLDNYDLLDDLNDDDWDM
ncbi:MAG: hypothetical protein IJ151_09170 [Bacteroidales bacterium]|nr:hypothetical protein [Bacteroidales bacterium]